MGVARAAMAYRAGGWRVDVVGVLAGGADLGGIEGGWGVTTDKAEWGVTGRILVRTDAFH